MALDTKTYWLTDRQSQCDFDFDNPVSWGLAVQLSSGREAANKWSYSWVDSWQVFWTGGCDKETWEQEAEESPLLEAVARKRLVKR
jgi:hypothetical protein